MFTIVEVSVKKISIFPSKFSNETLEKPKTFGVTFEVDGDVNLNSGGSASLIGSVDRKTSEVR